MMNLGTTLFLLISLSFWSKSLAQTCLSTGNGDWNITTTWNCDGVNRLPTCGDTVLVASSHIITVTNQNDYQGCGASMVLDVSGEMSFNNGNKLELPCGSLVSIQSGGAVYKSTAGGGTSTLISICNSNIWTAADGRLDGPTSFGGFILPVELLRLDVERLDEDQVKVTWTTASEVNSDFFTLYNGTSSKEWNVVDVVPGAGFSSEMKQYEVILHESDLEGYFFRLEQTDFDGTTEVLGYVRLKEPLPAAPEVMVWPNPTRGKFYVDLSEVLGEVVISLFDQNGKEVQNWQIPENSLTASIDIDPAMQADGFYFIRVKDERSTRMSKLMIQQ